jgi:hypothetical protein
LYHTGTPAEVTTLLPGSTLILDLSAVGE